MMNNSKERKAFVKKQGLDLETMRYLVLIIIILIMGLIFTLRTRSFLSYSNLMNIINQTAITLVVSIGMTFVILIGGIDLSVGSNIAVSGMLGVLILEITNNTILSVFTTVITSMLFGAINGFLVAKLGIVSFIVTLAMQFVGRGATMLLNGAMSIKVNNIFYKTVGQGSIWGIPTMLIIVLFLYSIFIIINNYTKFGRKLYAVGGNKNAAKASGINVERTTLYVYLICGLLSGIGAIMTVGRLGSAQPYAGQNLEFACITAVVLGGTSLDGGRGNLKGTILGALLVGIVSNGLSLMQVEKFFEYIATGLLVLFAVLSDMFMAYIYNKKLIPVVEPLEINDDKRKIGMSYQEANLKSDKDSHRVDMINISKAFPGMLALDGVNLSIRPYEIHALMGENGAGKTTLMRILCGELQPDGGQIYIDGKPVEIASSLEAKNIGITLIHQEMALIPELTVTQNIYLGKEEKHKIPIFLNERKMKQGAQEQLDKLGFQIDLDKKVSNLTVSEQQIVEIAKALAGDAWLIIMDEPTSSLSSKEEKLFFSIIENLKKQGICIIYISHKMQEIYDICDKITILRDGKLIDERDLNEIDQDEIVRLMVGREIKDVFTREHPDALGKTIFEVKKLSKKGVFNNISFAVKEKEILGLYGLVGAGRTEVARAIFGLDPFDSGEIFIDGEKVLINNTQDALDLGIAYVPEDRRKDGFVPLMSIKNNLALSSYNELSNRMGFFDSKKEKDLAYDYIEKLQIKTPSMEKRVLELSGGNQQKVTLGSRLAVKPRILILDEPTRGVDVGAKAEIHKIISDFAKNDVAIILISSEMPELIGVADRVLVMREGLISAVLERNEIKQDTIMKYAFQK
ncbi:MAG: ATP-binding cassette domain-containing protein [Saccharofermentanales bacterium]